MKRIVAFMAPALCLTLAGAPGFAQEAIRTGDGGAPPLASAPMNAAGATRNDPEAIGARTRRAQDAAPAGPGATAAPPDQCAAIRADGKPHGAVWAGAGSQRYRQVGGVVTQPLGACGSLTVMIDRTQGGYGDYSLRHRPAP